MSYGRVVDCSILWCSPFSIPHSVHTTPGTMRIEPFPLPFASLVRLFILWCTCFIPHTLFYFLYVLSANCFSSHFVFHTTLALRILCDLQVSTRVGGSSSKGLLLYLDGKVSQYRWLPGGRGFLFPLTFSPTNLRWIVAWTPFPQLQSVCGD